MRLYEFGVLKALGFSHRRMIALTAAETGLPCLAGAVLGLAAAKLLFAALAVLLPPLAAFPPPVYTPVLVGSGFAIALLIALLSAAIPALRIGRLDAAVALAGGMQTWAPRNARSGREAHTDTGRLFRAGEMPPVVEADLRMLRQVAVVTRIGLSTLRRRIKGALMIMVGVGSVVFVLLSILSIAEGIRTAVLDSGDPDRVLLHQASTPWLHQSNLPDGVAKIAAAAPGVAHAASGTPLVEAEILGVAGSLAKRNDGEMGNTTIIGVGPHWRDMTPSFRLLSGRMPRAVAKELIAGDLARRKFSGLDAGATQYRDMRWRIVGTFTTGDWWDGYLVGDVTALRLYTNHPTDSIVRVRLTSPQAFEAFRGAIASQLPSSVAVERETDYYARLWESIPKIIYYCAYVICGLIAVGVFAATAQIMNGVLEERSREVATLRTLGFDSRAVAASAVLEAMFLAVLGACIGAALAWLWQDGFLYNGAWDVFRVTVDLHLMLVAMAWALAIALIGTLPLAVRTVRESEMHTLQNL